MDEANLQTIQCSHMMELDVSSSQIHPPPPKRAMILIRVVVKVKVTNFFNNSVKRDFELGLLKVTSHSHPQTNIKLHTKCLVGVAMKQNILLNKHKDLIVGGHVSHHNFSSTRSRFHFLKVKVPLFSFHSSICPLFLFIHPSA